MSRVEWLSSSLLFSSLLSSLLLSLPVETQQRPMAKQDVLHGLDLRRNVAAAARETAYDKEATQTPHILTCDKVLDYWIISHIVESLV